MLCKAVRFVAKKLQSVRNFGANIPYPKIVSKLLVTNYQKQN
jgi:hypothetical protein